MSEGISEEAPEESKEASKEASEEASQEASQEAAMAEACADSALCEAPDEAPPPDSCEKALHDLASSVSKMGEQLLGLEKLFKTRILRTEHEEKIVDQMHRELQRHKDDLYLQLIRPVLLDLIGIRDSILTISSASRAKPLDEQHIPLDTFELYAHDVKNILEKNNIDIYRSEANSVFVPIRQRTARKVATQDKELHGKLAESLSDGYEFMGRTIAPEKVAVYIFNEEEN